VRLPGGPPGSLTRLEGDRIPSAFSNKLSPHQHGINDLLATLKLLGRAPARVVLHGVTPARIELGMDLSPEVLAALPELCARVALEAREAPGRAARRHGVDDDQEIQVLEIPEELVRRGAPVDGDDARGERPLGLQALHAAHPDALVAHDEVPHAEDDDALSGRARRHG